MNFQFVKTEIGADPIIVEGFIAATPKAVFRAWTDPKLVKKWFGPQPHSLISADIDLRVGGAWRFVLYEGDQGSMGFEGVYLVIDQDSRLVKKWSKFTISASGVRHVTPLSQVDITLNEKGSGTEIRISHSAIADRDTRIGFTSGWEHGIENLRNLFEEPDVG